MFKISKKMTALALTAVTLLLLTPLSFAQENATENAIDYSIQPSLGNDNAPAKVMLFEDFTCSHCATFTEQVLPKLKEEFLENGQAEFFFINNQFLGPNSIMAGMAGECAYEQDEALFWDYKTILFRAQNQIRYDAATLASLVASVPGLDQAAMESCISERRHMQTVNDDLLFAKGLGVTSTPTVFVNGQMVVVEYNNESDPMDQFQAGIARDILAAVAAAPAPAEAPVAAPEAPLAAPTSETEETSSEESNQ